MKRYIIGFLSFFDNCINLEEVFANDELEAYHKFMRNQGFNSHYINTCPTIADIECLMSNIDASISIKEIK
jgi:hypothetical protein